MPIVSINLSKEAYRVYEKLAENNQASKTVSKLLVRRDRALRAHRKSVRDLYAMSPEDIDTFFEEL